MASMDAHLAVASDWWMPKAFQWVECKVESHLKYFGLKLETIANEIAMIF